MDLELVDLIDSFDFDNYDYYYHETSDNIAEEILETGIIISEDNTGDNILNTSNIAESTIARLYNDDVKDIYSFTVFINNEISNNIRKVNEMVIIQIPKGDNNYVQKICTIINGIKTKGLISPNYILGYVNMDGLVFYPSENFEIKNTK